MAGHQSQSIFGRESRAEGHTLDCAVQITHCTPHRAELDGLVWTSCAEAKGLTVVYHGVVLCTIAKP